MAIVPELLKAGCRVVDLSADYRFNDPAVYEKWYGHAHTDPGRLGKTVYGLPELFGDRIPAADLIANPGCYTSTSILGLAPFLCQGLIDPKDIIIDAKSGVSGAGRTPKLNLHVFRMQRKLCGLFGRKPPPRTGNRTGPLRRERHDRSK